jgi:uncharacterized membrane protein
MEIQEETPKKNEKEGEGEQKTFMGYLLPSNPMVISLIGVFGALSCIMTMIIIFSVPATQGYINLGDAAVMISGLLFGPVVGGIAGGVGSCLADIFLGFPIYAPATLIIKGLEGVVVGLIADPKKTHDRINIRDILAVLIGGLIMIFGYLVYEIILYGLAAAIFEAIFNGFIQYGVAIGIALLITIPIRKNLTQALPQVFDKVFIDQQTENKTRDT